MGTKVFFVGNVFGGDDGIGPALYQRLKEDPELEGVTLLEAGVIGFDMVGDVEEHDSVIIVDALRAEEGFGDVVLLGEDDLSKDLRVVSEHDFGVEQTAAIMRSCMPGLKALKIIGIKVKEVKGFREGLSPELQERMEGIVREVKESIIGLSG